MLTRLEAKWFATRSQLKAIELRAIAQDFRYTETAELMERIAEEYERQAEVLRSVYDVDVAAS